MARQVVQRMMSNVTCSAQHSAMDKIFDLESYYSQLKTVRLGRPCVYLDSVDSTIEVAGNKSPDTIVLAKEQLNGRGQRSNVWQSPIGCAMASIRIACGKITPLASRLCFLQHILVLAEAKTLECIDGKKLGKNNIKLKWPNDIMYVHPNYKAPLKIGGVLVHTKECEDYYDITLSFGLNVFNSHPTICIRDIVGPLKKLSIDSVVADIMNRLEEYTYGLDDEKFNNLKLGYIERCIQMNKIVEDELNGQVKVRDVSDDGYLIGERCVDQKRCTITKIF